MDFLNPTQVNYELYGFGVFRGVLDSSQLVEVNHHLLDLQTRLLLPPPAYLLSAPVQNDPLWAKIVANPRLLDIVEFFLGSNLALFSSNYVVKPPHDKAEVLWHQDGYNWPLEPIEVVTVWLALDDTTPENGCLRFIPGSHKLPLHPLQPRPDIPNIFGGEIDPALVDETLAVDVPLKAGDISVHHPNIIHSSGANRSDKRRAGLSIRYISTRAQITAPQPLPSVMLLRGEATPGVNNFYHPFPIT